MRPALPVVAALREAIVGGQLLPNERLVEAELSERFQTTRAQIRSALATLEVEGLVVSVHNRGARVRRITADEALEITEARSSLEVLVAGKAAERATPEDIGLLDELVASMRSAHEREDLLGYSAINGEFHAAIRKMARHEVARKLLATLNSQIIRFQFSAILIPGRATQSLAEHETLLQAIRAHDVAGAQAAMTHHLSHVTRALRQAIEAQDGHASLAQARMLHG